VNVSSYVDAKRRSGARHASRVEQPQHANGNAEANAEANTEECKAAPEVADAVDVSSYVKRRNLAAPGHATRAGRAPAALMILDIMCSST
jgi:hypothetical protein